MKNAWLAAFALAALVMAQLAVAQESEAPAATQPSTPPSAPPTSPHSEPASPPLSPAPPSSPSTASTPPAESATASTLPSSQPLEGAYTPAGSQPVTSAPPSIRSASAPESPSTADAQAVGGQEAQPQLPSFISQHTSSGEQAGLAPEFAQAVSSVGEALAQIEVKLEPAEEKALARELVAADPAVVKEIAVQVQQKSAVLERVAAFAKQAASGAETRREQELAVQAVVAQPAIAMALLAQGAGAKQILGAAAAARQAPRATPEPEERQPMLTISPVTTQSPTPSASPSPSPTDRPCGGYNYGSCPEGMTCQPYNDAKTGDKRFRCEQTFPTPGPGCIGVVCGQGQWCNPDTGSCEGIPCYPGCPYGYSCWQNVCQPNCVITGCPAGSHCYTGGGAAYCTPDTCEQTGCPPGLLCVNRRCISIPTPRPTPTPPPECGHLGQECCDEIVRPGPLPWPFNYRSYCYEGECFLDQCISISIPFLSQ